LLAELIKTENDKYGPYYLLIAEKYYEKSAFEKAKSFFHIILTKMKHLMTKIDIWIKYGNCLKHLDENENAINAYRNAVKLDNSNCEAAILLVELLKTNILFDEASDVIRTSL
jgi:tetratricopeptide (TPR) repeat protein